ncbi:MAG: LTA synthase family protein [Longimicrobiales bacterium]|nr:LTA synthase family protein [Longimicrobiales bacterium]
MSPPPFPTLLKVNASVIWTWMMGVVMGFGVQLAGGLGQPSQGLALSAAALPAALVAASPPRVRRWSMLATVTLLGLAAIADALHHRVLGTYLPLRSLMAVGQGWAVRDYAAGLLGAQDVMPVLAVLLTAIAVLPRPRPAVPVSPRWHTALPLTLCLLGSAPALGWAWWVAPGTADTDTGGFLYAHVVDARRILGEWSMSGEPGPEELERVLRFTGPDSGAEAEPDPWLGRAAGSSVLLIQVEALNGWLLDADVEGEPVVPFLRSLAERGLHFTNVFDETHQGRSSDADYLVMASQHPLEHDAVSMVRPGLDMVALPDVLRGRGYATFSAHAHSPGFWNSAVRHERYGFQESLFEADLGPGESLGFGLRDRVFLERVAPRLAALPGPYLGWLITLTMHAPHPDIPPGFGTLSLGALQGTSLGNYFRKARHTDDALRGFLDTLDAAGALDQTTTVVFGDHTDSHRFDMGWVHRAAGVDGLNADVQHLLLDRVPLIVVLPGTAEGRRIPTVGGLIDVAPTVLRLLGVEPPRSWLGRSLTSPGPATAAQASGEVVGDDRMWTGVACYGFPDPQPRPATDCAGLRAGAREELEVSWLITRRGLSPRLDTGTTRRTRP